MAELLTSAWGSPPPLTIETIEIEICNMVFAYFFASLKKAQKGGAERQRNSSFVLAFAGE